MMVVGRTATVTGIARRPFPSATDRRFAITPRFPVDVRVSGPAVGGSGSVGSSAPGGGGSAPFAASSDPSIASNDLAGAGAPDADLVDLGAYVGRTVRVGGLVVDLRSDGFTLDDGTAVGRVLLRDTALEELALIEPDDALNAIGHVEATTDGDVVVVDDPGGIIVTGDPVAGAASPSPSSVSADGAVASTPPDAAARFAGLGGGSFPLDPGAAGLGTLLAISAISLGVTLLRREHARRRLATRIAGRLVTFAGPTAGPSGGPSGPLAAEREPSTIHSA